MTTTETMADAGLTAPSHDDNMEIATSPYLNPEDYEFELDDDGNHVEEHNMLEDEAHQFTESDTFDQPMDQGQNHDYNHEETYDLEITDVADENETENNEHHMADEEFADDALNLAEEPEIRTYPVALVADQEQSVDDEQDQETEDHLRIEEDLFDEEEEEQETTTNTANNGVPPTNYITHETTEAKHQETEDQQRAQTVGDEIRPVPQQLPSGAENEQIRDPVDDDDDDYLDLDLAEPDDTETSKDQDKQQLTLDTAVATHQSPTNSTHSPVPLHPVMVRYGDETFPLFAAPNSEDTDEALLQDFTLANETFDKFLRICRETLGELGHDDELVFEVPSLGLIISEDSKYAGKVNLVQVIDTYMLLSQNEQLAEIPPLECRISQRVCLETQLAYLVTSAREGKTYGQITEEHIDTPYLEHQDTYKTVDEENFIEDDAQVDTNNVNAAQVHEADEVNHEDKTEDYDQAYPDDQYAVPEQEHDVAEAATESHQDAEAAKNKPPSPEDHQESAGPGTSEDAEEILVFEEDEAPTQPDQPNTEPVQNDEVVEDHDSVPELEEDLFAEEDLAQDLAPLTNTADEDHLDFDAWDLETEDNLVSITAEPPVTPAKGVNGKRKLEENEDDILDLDFTPEPKRTKSS